MILFPAIDIRNGNCVSLKQGDYEQEKIYHKSPVTVALEWEEQGAEYLHIVDLDGAKTGKPANQEVIQSIMQHISIPVQIGGGIRSMDTIQAYINLGVNRIIIGTAAIDQWAFLQRALERFSDKIAVSIDARNGYAATNGWLQTSEIRAAEFIKKLENSGVATIIYTDILKDGMLSGPNFTELKAIQADTSVQVIASGGVTTTSDIEQLQSAGLYGAIIGKALYDGTLSLSDLTKENHHVR